MRGRLLVALRVAGVPVFVAVAAVHAGVAHLSFLALGVHELALVSAAAVSVLIVKADAGRFVSRNILSWMG